MIVSIIIPCRNEEKYIRKTIDSIIGQDFNYEFEVIVVDGNSIDSTKEILYSYQKDIKNLIILDNPKKIVPISFNLGLNQSKGKYIIRVDAHSIIEKDFLKNCINVIDRKNADCVGGATLHISNGIVSDSIMICQTSKFGSGGVYFRRKNSKGRYVDTLAFGAYKRSVFQSIGGYDEELIRNQDDEFNFRLCQSGGDIWLDPTIKSSYFPRNSLMSFIKQYFQYGFYKIRVMQKRKGFSSWRHIVPICFVLIFIIATFLNFYNKITFPLLLIITVYFSLSIIASYKYLFTLRYNLISIVLLPLSYFLMHFSYGIGNLCGIIYFINKWNDREVKDNHFNAKRFSENATY